MPRDARIRNMEPVSILLKAVRATVEDDERRPSATRFFVRFSTTIARAPVATDLRILPLFVVKRESLRKL
jgi:hypothetical protein